MDAAQCRVTFGSEEAVHFGRVACEAQDIDAVRESYLTGGEPHAAQALCALVSCCSFGDLGGGRQMTVGEDSGALLFAAGDACGAGVEVALLSLPLLPGLPEAGV